MSQNRPNARYRYGTLPEQAPLAMAYVPMQTSAQPSFEANEALARGTLFPGLELPFMDLVNDALPSSPKTEMMAIDFVCDELELYLDTHSEDDEAFALYQTMLALQQEARTRYVRLCGPVQQTDMLNAESYTWLNDPWPWDFPARRES